MTSPTIIHMDMDAFFASVEQLDNPGLRNTCLVVGGPSRRGVVAAASYEARRYGIHSAMPIFQAQQKCPHLVVVPPRRERYSALSRKIMAILNTFSPLVEQLSIDEAYVDITGCARLHGAPREIAVSIKKRIQEITQLSSSVGVAPNKFLAKIASDMHKPDGLTIIKPEQVAGFVATLPIQKVPGVGAQAQKKLDAMGIQQLGQVGCFPRERIIHSLGKFGERLILLSQGVDDSPVTPHREPQSISSETTLSKDTLNHHQLAAHLLSQAQSVARQLRQHHLTARTITLKIRTADFQRHSRSRTVINPMRASDLIYQTALSLLEEFALTRPARLVGVGASGLQPETKPVQQDLFVSEQEIHHHKWERIDQAMDAVAQRYGHRLVDRGSLADLPKAVKKRTKE